MADADHAGSGRRLFLTGALLAAGGGLAFAAQPRHFDRVALRTSLARLIPRRLGQWRFVSENGLILPDGEDVPDQLYDAVVARVYTAPNMPPMMLTIAYGGAQTGSWSIHRPESCYPASGFQVTTDRDADIPVGGRARVPMRFLTATRQDRIEQIGYWRRVSDAFPVTVTEERLVLLRRSLAGVVPDGVLVRISTLGLDVARAQAEIARFAGALAGGCGPGARTLLLGPTIAAAIPRTASA